jgi:hypothetical protein
MIKMTWREAMLGVLAALMLATPALAKPLTPVQFRNQARAAVERLVPGVKVRVVDERTLRVRLPGAAPADELQMMLDGAYDRYLNDPEAREAIIEQMVRLLVSANTPQAATQDNMVILLRPADYLESSGLGAVEALNRPFGEGFIEIVALDVGETFRVVGLEDLLPVGRDKDTIWRKAAENTRAKNAVYNVSRPEPGAWMISSDSSLAPYFVMTPDVWAANGVVMKGDPIAVFLERNLLLLADGGDKDLMKGLPIFLSKVKDEPGTISTTMYIRRNGVWSVLEQGQ